MKYRILLASHKKGFLSTKHAIELVEWLNKTSISRILELELENKSLREMVTSLGKIVEEGY